MITMRPDYRYVNGLRVLMSCIGRRNMVGIEVGSFAGQGAEIMLGTGLVRKLYCVDPWSPGYDSGDAASSESEMVAAEIAFDARFSGDGRVTKVRSTFHDAVGIVPECPDFVYIDATHTYGGCSGDIRDAMTLRPAVICGHDYEEAWSGVRNAVNDAFGFPDAVFSDTSWAVFNPSERYRLK